MTDEYIVDQVLKGNTHIFAEIVNRYKDKAFSAAYRFTSDHSEAQDICQDLFINLFKNLHKYNEECKFSTWLYRMHYNICIDWCRKNKTKLKQMSREECSTEVADKKFNLEEDFIQRQRKTALRNAIHTLDEKYRNVLILFHYQGLSYEEIGQVMKLPVKTVETRLYRARNQLRKSLSSYENGGEFNEMQTGSQFN